MHVVIEKARKAAGISGLNKNYPDNPKQRGCGFWAAFLGSVGNDLGRMDHERLQLLNELKDKAATIADLEHELNEVRKHQVKNGVETISLQEGWSVDKGDQLKRKLIG